jgi:predicted HTH transcriptional regulator
MANTADNLELYIQNGKEERYLEYKCSMIWTNNNATKVKIAKAMMAMSNLRNGGVIVIGMREIRRGVWEPEGMTTQQVASFNQDDIARWVNDCAIPAVQFNVKPFTYNDNEFVIIRVREFDSMPTICHKQKPRGGSEVLKAGAIYYRSRQKNESAPISSEEDMRELITLAISKGAAQQITLCEELGLAATSPALQEGDALKYEREREGY